MRLERSSPDWSMVNVPSSLPERMLNSKGGPLRGESLSATINFRMLVPVGWSNCSYTHNGKVNVTKYHQNTFKDDTKNQLPDYSLYQKLGRGGQTVAVSAMMLLGYCSILYIHYTVHIQKGKNPQTLNKNYPDRRCTQHFWTLYQQFINVLTDIDVTTITQ